MKNIERISLAERLKNITMDEPDFLEVFEMFPEDYFNTWAELTENQQISNLYYENIVNYSLSGGKQHYLNEVVQRLESVPDDERDAMLYKILIEPFVQMKGVLQK